LFYKYAFSSRAVELRRPNFRAGLPKPKRQPFPKLVGELYLKML